MAEVLLVDDNVELMDSLSAVLTVRGYTVHTANGVAPALDVLRSGDIDILVTDILMPDRDGLSMLREISEDAQLDLPVIAMSGGGGGFQGADALAFAQTYGAQSVLFKPFKADELEAAIKALLEAAVPAR